MRGAPLQTQEEIEAGHDALMARNDDYIAGWNAAIKAADAAIQKYGMERVNGMKDYPAATACACAHYVRELKR